MHYIMARVRRVIVAGGGFGSVALCNLTVNQGCSARARVCHENRETASARERLRACECSRGAETRSAGAFSLLDCSILDN